MAASSAQAAGGNVVSFGYADTERANATHFPTPWAGDPGVIFEGCQPNGTTITKCTFDSSAIKIDNNTGSDEQVNSVKLVFPGALAGGADCVIDIWPHDVTLPAGQTMILAQTTASPTETGCGQPAGTVDGSEVGPNGVNWGGQTHCATNSGIIPKVILTINNSTTTVTDTNQVLNTGGNDSANCPTRINPPHQNNESEPWGCVNGGQTLTLAPPTQTHFVGEQATIVATLTNTCGGPIQNADVHFTDTAGPDLNLTGSHLTDANGQAPLTYTGNFVGTDTWDSDVVNPAGTIVSNDVEVIWIKPPCPTGTKANFRWHYSANGTSGSWSATKGVTCGNSLSIGPSTMEGDLKVSPGDTLKAGYDFNIPGNTQTFDVNVGNPQAVFTVRCVSGAAPSQSTLTLAMPTQTYTVTNNAWYPSGDQKSPLVYQGSITVPDLCSGGQLRLDKGGTFTATVS